MPDTQKLCTLKLDGRAFAIPVGRIQELLRAQVMTPVPGADGSISGLINLRGQIVAAVDLRRRLGLAPREQGMRAMNVVVSTLTGPVSLLVDEVCDVVDADVATYEPSPRMLADEDRRLVPGAYKLEGALLPVLDVDVVLATGVPATPGVHRA